jgi:hypothetical protein
MFPKWRSWQGAPEGEKPSNVSLHMVFIERSWPLSLPKANAIMVGSSSQINNHTNYQADDPRNLERRKHDFRLHWLAAGSVLPPQTGRRRKI